MIVVCGFVVKRFLTRDSAISLIFDARLRFRFEPRPRRFYDRLARRPSQPRGRNGRKSDRRRDAKDRLSFLPNRHSRARLDAAGHALKVSVSAVAITPFDPNAEWGGNGLTDGKYPKYLRFIDRQVAKAVRLAAQSTRPARMKMGATDPVRSPSIAGMQTRTHGRPPVFYDEGLRVMQFAEGASGARPGDRDRHQVEHAPRVHGE